MPSVSLFRRALPASAALLFLSTAPLVAQQEDPFLWLEEVEGERAMEWVLAQNAETRAHIQALPTYQPLFDNTLEILTSNDRIAYPTARGEAIYNFWTDADHPRGIYRRTTWEGYLSGDAQWETILDFDALAEAEDVPWAFRGISCLLPEERYCLVNLSPGGSDATEVREFDVVTREFAEGGFRVPVSKNSVAWVDENTILVSHNLEETRTTTSGYSAAVRVWNRGTPLESATVLAEADRNDMAMWLGTQETSAGPIVMVQRLITIFDSEVKMFSEGELVLVDVPTDAQMGIVGDQMVLQLVSDWEVDGRTYEEGSVVSTTSPTIWLVAGTSKSSSARGNAPP